MAISAEMGSFLEILSIASESTLNLLQYMTEPKIIRNWSLDPPYRLNATQIIISPLKFVRNRFKLIISRKYFRNQYFNLRKIAFFAVNLNSLALLSLLTSKMLPNRGDLSSIHHFPYLTWQLTSIIDPFWDHFWAWLTKNVVNLTEINLNLLTLL